MVLKKSEPTNNKLANEKHKYITSVSFLDENIWSNEVLKFLHEQNEVYKFWAPAIELQDHWTFILDI